MPKALCFAASLAMLVVCGAAPAANIIESWDQVQPPPVPQLTAPTVKASDTALLVLDIEQATCNTERRPRCVAAAPAIGSFLARARAAHMPVFYSNTGMGSRETMLSEVAPKDDEPIVKAGVNKFQGTRLDEYLKAKNIKTVIVCGTTAFGAVLHTATGAALNGYKVIVPVDCMPGGSLYEEQASLWSVLNGPGSARASSATTLDAIHIE